MTDIQPSGKQKVIEAFNQAYDQLLRHERNQQPIRDMEF